MDLVLLELLSPGMAVNIVDVLVFLIQLDGKLPGVRVELPRVAHPIPLPFERPVDPVGHVADIALPFRDESADVMDRGQRLVTDAPARAGETGLVPRLLDAKRIFD